MLLSNWMNRRVPLMALFAIAALTARLWTYHLWYDDVVICFLLLAVLARALELPASRQHGLALSIYFLVGLSLWFTLGFLFRWPVVVVQNLLWIAAVAWLLRSFPDASFDRVAQLEVAGAS